MQWTRPKDVPVGQIWGRFKGREKNGKPAEMFQIRDLDMTKRKECLDMMAECFLRDEPLCIALDILSDKESLKTIRSNWEYLTDQGVSIACYTEVDGQPDRLVGFNITCVTTKHDEHIDLKQIKGDGWRQLLHTLLEAEDLSDVYTRYGVDTILSCSGCAVIPEYRGQSIGVRMLEAREQMCRAFGIKAAMSVFTAIASQTIAARAGFETLVEVPYTHMLKYGIDLSNCTTKSAKVMGIKYDF